MRIYVEIEYRDDKSIKHECVDRPSIGTFVTLYKKDPEQVYIPAEAIKQMRVFCK